MNHSLYIIHFYLPFRLQLYYVINPRWASPQMLWQSLLQSPFCRYTLAVFKKPQPVAVYIFFFPVPCTLGFEVFPQPHLYYRATQKCFRRNHGESKKLEQQKGTCFHRFPFGISTHISLSISYIICNKSGNIIITIQNPNMAIPATICPISFLITLLPVIQEYLFLTPR